MKSDVFKLAAAADAEELMFMRPKHENQWLVYGLRTFDSVLCFIVRNTHKRNSAYFTLALFLDLFSCVHTVKLKS